MTYAEELHASNAWLQELLVPNEYMLYENAVRYNWSI